MYNSNIFISVRKATRATLILVPLLGLQYLLFPIRPDADSELEDVYHVAVALLVSLQVGISFYNELTYQLYIS